IVSRRHAAPDRGPPPAEVLLGDLGDEVAMIVGNLAGGDRGNALKLPLLVEYEMSPQQRRLEQVEEVQTQAIIAFGEVPSEIAAKNEPFGLDGGEAFLNDLIEIVGHETNHAGGLEVLNGRDSGKRFMSARLRQQRDVVPDALVAVRAAEIEDLGAA